MLDCDLLEVGELAKKIKRGKNTTRKTEIFHVEENTYFVDTCGFPCLKPWTSSLKISDYILTIWKFSAKIVASICARTYQEPDCAVKAHVGNGIGIGRYQRYKTIYEELVQRRENKYD